MKALLKYLGAPHIKVGIFTLTLHLVDIDPRDGDVRIGISLAWK